MSTLPSHFKHLNEAQKEAVTTVGGPLLVLAGAGSGKTRVVTYRIAYLIEQGIPPSSILGLTFTNKAAHEMRERIEALTNHSILVCTFHALGARILRESIHHLGFQPDFTIYDEEDVKKLLRGVVKEAGFSEIKVDLKALKRLISHTKNLLLEKEEIDNLAEGTVFESCFSSIYSLYQRELQRCNALDFDDLLFLTDRLFRTHPEILSHYQDQWQFLLIDEYQDTNGIQFSIVNQLVRKSQNLCVVGDPDQSIYSWRGAQIDHILTFPRSYPKTKEVRLEQNYRSTETILSAANSLIGHNTNRFEKALWSNLGEGEKIKVFSAINDRQEANFIGETIRHYHKEKNIPYSQMAIFYRTNFQSRLLEDRLLFGKIPHVIVGGLSYYQRKEIKDILAFLKMVVSDQDFISFARTLNLPKRGIGPTTLENLRKGASCEGVPLLHYCHSLIEEAPLQHPCRLTKRQKTGLADYLTILNQLKELAKNTSLKTLVEETIHRTRYLNILNEDKETYEDRVCNVRELISKGAEWEQMTEEPTLATFLEELSLKSTLDEADGIQDQVNLMTIHNGKGLEFALVFLAGLEEDLFPHANARASEQAIEEERRLCYVGMTRAKQNLYLTHAKTRYLWGTERRQRTSRFLSEIKNTYLEKACRPGKKPSGEFTPGDTIFHKGFGIGTVKKVFNGNLGTTYMIQFAKDQRPRQIIAKYAQLNAL